MAGHFSPSPAIRMASLTKRHFRKRSADWVFLRDSGNNVADALPAQVYSNSTALHIDFFCSVSISSAPRSKFDVRILTSIHVPKLHRIYLGSGVTFVMAEWYLRRGFTGRWRLDTCRTLRAVTTYTAKPPPPRLLRERILGRALPRDFRGIAEATVRHRL
jgi:hypothetical protein